MMDRKEVIKVLTTERDYVKDIIKEHISSDTFNNTKRLLEAYESAITMLEESANLLGIVQTKDGISFISTGTAREGEERGMVLGKKYMHEWIYKEMLYKGLLTDEIRNILNEAKRL